MPRHSRCLDPARPGSAHTALGGPAHNRYTLPLGPRPSRVGPALCTLQCLRLATPPAQRYVPWPHRSRCRLDEAELSRAPPQAPLITREATEGHAGAGAGVAGAGGGACVRTPSRPSQVCPIGLRGTVRPLHFQGGGTSYSERLERSPASVPRCPPPQTHGPSPGVTEAPDKRPCGYTVTAEHADTRTRTKQERKTHFRELSRNVHFQNENYAQSNKSCRWMDGWIMDGWVDGTTNCLSEQ